MLRSTVILNRLLTRLRIRHVQVLVRLSELGNVKRTAQAIGMTQPAVSLLLADMERLIEAPLFLRHARGVTPTAMAHDLLPLARHMLTDVEAGAERVSARLNSYEGVVRVSASPAGMSAILANVLPTFARAHPQILVQVHEIDTPQIAQSAADGLTDIVLCRQPGLMPSDWRFTTCLQDHFVIACGNQHPLARRRRIRMDDLRDLVWLPNTVSSVAHARHESLMAQQGWRPAICQVVTRTVSLTWAMLDSEPLVTLIPLSVVHPWVKRKLLHMLPIDLQMPCDPIGMLLPDGPRSAASLALSGQVQAFAERAMEDR